MTEIDDVRAAYATGDPDYCEMINGLADAGVPWAAYTVVQAEAELDERNTDPLAGVDQGQLEALILEGRQNGAYVEMQLGELADAGAEELAYRILELCEGDGQEWAERLLHRSAVETEATWAEELAGRDFDAAKFEKAFAAAEANGEPEAGLAYYATDRLEPDPPEIGVRWADPGEVPGAEDTRHLVNAHSDGYDHAFAEFFAEERNRQNGHPDALEPDPEIQGDPMVRANLDAVAASMSDDIGRRNSVERHAREVQRRRAA
jgi:hypothetical protein